MTSHKPSRDPGSPHAGHDLFVVAAQAAGDATGAEAAQARALIAGCGDCRDLAADLTALRAATRELPLPRRARDFRLSPETAARLRNRAPWQRFMEGITAPRGFGRPLAGALVTLGLAGLMVSATPLGAPLAGSSASQNTERALAPSDASTGFSGGAAPQGLSPAGSPDDRTSQDSSTGGGNLDTAKGASGAAGASASPGVLPEAAMAAPTDGGRSSSSPPASPGAGQGPVTIVDGSPATPVSDGLAAGGATGARDAAAPSRWAGPSPLALLSLTFLLAGFAILLARRRMASGPA